MSQRCQQETHALQQRQALFDHVIVTSHDQLRHAACRINGRQTGVCCKLYNQRLMKAVPDQLSDDHRIRAILNHRREYTASMGIS